MLSGSERADVLRMLKALWSDVERDPRRLAGTDSLRLRFVWQPTTHPHRGKLWRATNLYLEPLVWEWSDSGFPLVSMPLELKPGDGEPKPCQVHFAAELSHEQSEAEIEFQKHLREATNVFHRMFRANSGLPEGDRELCLFALFHIFCDDLSWEGNEEPGRPETRSRIAELPNVYEKLEWLLRRRIQALGKRNDTKRHRRPGTAKQMPLTDLQTEAFSWFAELRGNYTQTGKRMGIGRKAAEQHVKAAYHKLGATLVKKTPKTTRLPTDKDGQANVTIEGDGQARVRRNSRRTKPVREDE